MLTVKQQTTIAELAAKMLADYPPAFPNEHTIYKCCVEYYYKAARQTLGRKVYLEAERRGYLILFANRLADKEIARFETDIDRWTVLHTSADEASDTQTLLYRYTR